jgi:signal peptidase I
MQRPGTVETIKTLVVAGLLALGIHSFLFQPFWIPSGSMVPSLLVGDCLFVSKFAYGFSRYSLPFAPPLFHGRIFGRAPKRGDVVVFESPTGSGEILIKRVIGLPGDKVQLVGGQLYINGQIVPRVAEGSYVDDSDGGPVVAQKFAETLPGGKVHDILKLTDDGFANNTPVYMVPADNLFVMGDNRDNSEDSRFMDGPVGYVPEENVLGPAVLILGSIAMQEPARWPGKLRWSRFFRAMH